MKCPHCLLAFHGDLRKLHQFEDSSATWELRSAKCPTCLREILSIFQLEAAGYTQVPGGNPTQTYRVVRSWPILPRAVNRSLPPQVPAKYSADFAEACAVLPDSPKASAALSRRCLQLLLRDEYAISHRTLDAEIQAAIDSNKFPTYITEALDAIRVLGNFAAHPIKNVTTGAILEVEPGEAEQQLDTLEFLFDFTFVQPDLAKQKRAAINAKLAAANKPPLK